MPISSCLTTIPYSLLSLPHTFWFWLPQFHQFPLPRSVTPPSSLSPSPPPTSLCASIHFFSMSILVLNARSASLEFQHPWSASPVFKCSHHWATSMFDLLAHLNINLISTPLLVQHTTNDDGEQGRWSQQISTWSCVFSRKNAMSSSWSATPAKFQIFNTTLNDCSRKKTISLNVSFDFAGLICQT